MAATLALPGQPKTKLFLSVSLLDFYAFRRPKELFRGEKEFSLQVNVHKTSQRSSTEQKFTFKLAHFIATNLSVQLAVVDQSNNNSNWNRNWNRNRNRSLPGHCSHVNFKLTNASMRTFGPLKIIAHFCLLTLFLKPQACIEANIGWHWFCLCPDFGAQLYCSVQASSTATSTRAWKEIDRSRKRFLGSSWR